MASALRLRATPRLLLLAFVLATVSIRLVPLLGSSPDTDTKGRERIIAFFDKQGFPYKELPDLSGVRLFSGEKGFCRIVVGDLHLLGWQNDIMQQVGEVGDLSLFLFDGVPFADPPVWASRIAFYRDRVMRVLGHGDSRTHLYGILASPGCAQHPIDWTPLQG